MSETVLSAAQRDALREIHNLTIGRAGARLALIRGAFIEL
ncbi:chemotaxis protein, partial [Burkholderia pseudomallei]|nr:chemotaxis protein [Burkholderia pseudomallei]